MGNKNKEDDIIGDCRTISIHEFPWCGEAPLEDCHSKVLLYYLSENNDKKDYRSDEKLKEGYIIEAKIQTVARSKIEYITKEYFDKTYRELKNINFEKLAEEHYTGCDGGQLEIEMGWQYSFNQYTRKLSLFSPHEENDRPELLKLLRIVNNIKNKIKFDQWYQYTYDELQKCREIIGDYGKMFRYRGIYGLPDYRNDDW